MRLSWRVIIPYMPIERYLKLSLGHLLLNSVKNRFLGWTSNRHNSVRQSVSYATYGLQKTTADWFNINFWVCTRSLTKTGRAEYYLVFQKVRSFECLIWSMHCMTPVEILGHKKPPPNLSLFCTGLHILPARGKA